MGCHSLLQGTRPDPGIKPWSPTLEAYSLPSEPPGKPLKLRGGLKARGVDWRWEPIYPLVQQRVHLSSWWSLGTAGAWGSRSSLGCGDCRLVGPGWDVGLAGPGSQGNRVQPQPTKHIVYPHQVHGVHASPCCVCWALQAWSNYSPGLLALIDAFQLTIERSAPSFNFFSFSFFSTLALWYPWVSYTWKAPQWNSR